MKTFVIGDSTTAEYGKESFPQQCWAHYLKDYFIGAEIINYACGLHYSYKRSIILG